MRGLEWPSRRAGLQAATAARKCLHWGLNADVPAESHLVLGWRTYLTSQMCKAFFREHTYYQVVHTEGIDNPDQRIQQDVASFVSTSTGVGLRLTQTVFNCVAFGGVSW
jgi:ABC-type uncharacterized transport system fused permease/ATPase subunit